MSNRGVAGRSLTDIVWFLGRLLKNAEQDKQHSSRLHIFKGYFQLFSPPPKACNKQRQQNNAVIGTMQLQFSFSLVLFIVLNLGLGLYILGWTPKFSRDSDFIVASYVFAIIISSYLTQFFGKFSSPCVKLLPSFSLRSKHASLSSPRVCGHSHRWIGRWCHFVIASKNLFWDFLQSAALFDGALGITSLLLCLTSCCHCDCDHRPRTPFEFFSDSRHYRSHCPRSFSCPDDGGKTFNLFGTISHIPIRNLSTV
jgi:hypothetical protein